MLGFKDKSIYIRRISIWASVSLVFIFMFLSFAGGIHYYSYSRYFASSSIRGYSESDFRLKIFPKFSSGGSSGLKCLVPNLFYRQWEDRTDTQIIAEITPGSHQYGNFGKTNLVLEEVAIHNERNQVTMLVTENSPVFIDLTDPRYAVNSKIIGPVSGKFVVIKVSGYVTTTDGLKRKFDHEQAWKEDHSSRFGLGIMFGE